MSSVRLMIVAAGGVCGLLVLHPACSSAQGTSPAVTSAAFGIQAQFNGGGMSTALGPVAPVSGSAPPAYSKTKVVTSYNGTVAIPPLVPGQSVYPMVASLTVEAAMLTSHVASAGIQIDNVSSSGASSVASASLRIANPEPVLPPIPVLAGFLTVVADTVKASASYTKVFPSAASVTGAASFGSLRIGGSLLGGQTISYSGAAPANTVLYSSPTLTITVHQQIIGAVVSCPPCTVTPGGIVVHALDISLDNAVIDGRTVSGDITLGDASAAE